MPISGGQQGQRGALWLPMLSVWVLILHSTLLPFEETFAKSVIRFGVGMVACATLAFHWNSRRRSEVMWLCLPWALFVGLAMLSVLWSPLRMTSFWQAGNLCIQFALAVSIGVLARSLDLSFAMLNISAVLLANSIIVLLAFLFIPGLESLTRVAEGAFHASGASATASLGILLLSASCLLWNWNWSRLLFFPGMAVHALLLYLAVNRLSILLALVVASLAMFLASARNRVLASAGVLAICLCASVYLAADPGMRRVDHVLDASLSYVSRGQTFQQLTELSGRAEMWQVVWNEYLRSPWWGHGYYASSPEGVIHVWGEWGNWTAHNLVLQCLMSVGLMGLLLAAWGGLRISRALIHLHRCGRLPRQLGGFILLAGIWTVGWGAGSEFLLGPMAPETIGMFAVSGIVLGQVASAQEVPAADAIPSLGRESAERCGNY